MNFTKKPNSSAAVVLLCILILSGEAWSGLISMGKIGETYPIKENDALMELQEKAKSIDFSKIADKKVMEQKIKNFKPETVKKLPVARENRAFLVDMTHALDFDIPDQNGNVLYPKGFKFNPLDFMQMKRTYVFIDGTDADQIAWLQNSPHYKRLSTTILLTDGNWYDTRERIKRPVYYALGEIVTKFQIECVPAVVRQEGKYMKVEEIQIEKGKNAIK